MVSRLVSGKIPHIQDESPNQKFKWLKENKFQDSQENQQWVDEFTPLIKKKMELLEKNRKFI